MDPLASDMRNSRASRERVHTHTRSQRHALEQTGWEGGKQTDRQARLRREPIPSAGLTEFLTGDA